MLRSKLLLEQSLKFKYIQSVKVEQDIVDIITFQRGERCAHTRPLVVRPRRRRLTNFASQTRQPIKIIGRNADIIGPGNASV